VRILDFGFAILDWGQRAYARIVALPARPGVPRSREVCVRRSIQNPKSKIQNGLRACLCVLALLLASCSKQPEPPKPKDAASEPLIVPTVTVDKPVITIGEKIRYTVSVEAAPELEVTFPEFGSNLAGFAIKDFGSDGPTKTDDGRVVRKRWYVLDTYVTGAYNIPPATVKYKTPGGEEKEIKTTDIFVEVKSVAKAGEQAEDIRDIQQPVAIRPNYRRLYLWGGVAAALAGLIALTSFVVARRRRGLVPAPLPPRPPHELAYEALAQLVDSDLIAKGQIKEFYYRLSEITRQYIEGRFRLMAPERTTEEFLLEMSQTNLLEQSHKQLVGDFLGHCDLVKFAKYGPTRSEIESAYNAAKRLVDETREDAGMAGEPVTGMTNDQPPMPNRASMPKSQ